MIPRSSVNYRRHYAERPFLIGCLGILQFIAAGTVSLMFILIGFGLMLPALAKNQSGAAYTAAGVIGLVILLFCALLFFLAHAFWSGKWWAWWLQMTTHSYSFFTYLPMIIYAFAFAGIESIPEKDRLGFYVILFIQMPVVCFWMYYFFRTNVLDFFSLNPAKRLVYFGILFGIYVGLNALIVGSLVGLVALSGKPLSELAQEMKQKAEEAGRRAKQPESVLCSKPVQAYDVETRSKVIGTFQAGTKLDVVMVSDDGQWATVAFHAPDGNVINAACKSPDLNIGYVPPAQAPLPNLPPEAENNIRGGPRPMTTIDDTPAYDLANPSKQIGTFLKGTRLEMIDMDPGSKLIKVRFISPDGKVMVALCGFEHLKNASQ